MEIKKTIPFIAYNGILFRHKKEWNWAICRDVHGPRDCQTAWSESEREKQILENNTYTWNLEKRYRWPYLQSRNTDTKAENKCMDNKGERSWVGGTRRLGLSQIQYVTDSIYKTDKWWDHTAWYRELYLSSVVTWIGRKSKKEGDICICMADSFFSAVEANTTF